MNIVRSHSDEVLAIGQTGTRERSMRVTIRRDTPDMGTPDPSSSPPLAWAREGAVFGAYGEWSWDVEWLLEEAASHAAQTSWARMGHRRPSEARALILQWYRRRMGITVVRAMARHRWRHSQYVGSRECSLSTPGGGRIGSIRGRRESAGGTPLGGGSEDGAGALLPLAAGVVRETGERSVGVA